MQTIFMVSPPSLLGLGAAWPRRFWQALLPPPAHARLAAGPSLRTVNFDEHDWEIGQGRIEEARGGSGAWKLALGVVLGMALGGALVYGLGRYQARSEAAEAARAIERSLHSAGPTAAGLPPLPASEPAAAQAANDAPAALPKAEPGVPIIAASPVLAPREPDPAIRAAQRALERKEKAWAAYYKKPASCDDNPSKDTMVECANHYIRAKRQFEQDYAGGGR
jgi:hypothetical protein